MAVYWPPILLFFLSICSGFPRNTPITNTSFGTPNKVLHINQKGDKKVEEGNLAERIIGGSPALKGQFPGQAYLRLYAEGQFLACGGALVSRTYVITAAHCLKGILGALVLLGTPESNKLFSSGAQMFLVFNSHFFIHPDYDEDNIKNDIALIRLPKPVILNFLVRPIRLPSKEHNKVDSFANHVAYISGWGRTSDNSLVQVPTSLQYSKVTICPHNYCKKFYASIYTLSDNQICTYFNNSGTCNGDSGGPLITANNILAGVVSFGLSLCEIRAPSAYTFVPSYIDWIQSVLKL